MIIIKLVALAIFAIACVTIYHNTNSFEPSKRILYIVVRNACNVCNNRNNLYNRCNKLEYTNE